MSGALFGRTQSAIQTPFEPNRNPQYGGAAGPSGINSVETQSAIEEAKNTAPGTAARYTAGFAYQGGASNHWLDNHGLPSNTNPFIIAETSTLKAISVVVQNNKPTNATFTIYKNAISLTTITLTNQYKQYVSGLAFALVAGDELSVFAIQNGGAPNPLTSPVLHLFIATAGA